MKFSAIYKAFLDGVRNASRQVIAAMRGRPVSVFELDRQIDKFDADARAAVIDLAETAYNKFLRGAQAENLLPMRALLAERESTVASAIQNYRFLVDESIRTVLSIGRKTHMDVLREFSLKQIEAGFINDNPGIFTAETLAQKIKAAGIDVGAKAPRELLDEIRNEFFDKIPMFKNADGKYKFYLLNKNNRYMAFDVQHYSDLVGLTTIDEARHTATLERARSLNTRFIRYNSTGKGSAYYSKNKDDVCATIDGGIFAIVQETTQNGTTGAQGKSGKFYPYIKEVIPGAYNRPHPFCRHQATPWPESAA